MESKRKFNVGDRVRLLARYRCGFDGSLKYGHLGTVVGYYPVGDGVVCVSWDNFRSGHNCDGLLTSERVHSGWNFSENHLEFAEETEPISLDISSIL